MATLYILAIGGSGARVVRSLAMLLPTLPSFGRFDTIKPVLIDADEKNGSLDRAKNILAYYEKSSEKLSPSGYFKTKIEKHDEKYVHLVDVKNSDSSKFEDYIDYAILNKKNKDTAKLIKLLFSGKSSAGIPLLDLDMDVGFQGNPNVGSVVMSDFAENFLSKMSLQANDEVLFITSIFGGTGAAGFPAFLSRMRKDDKTIKEGAMLKNVKVGAISLLPYYGLPPKETQSQLNGLHFIPKTKSALNYYLGNIYTDKKSDDLKAYKESDLEYFCYIGHEFHGAKQPKNERGGKGGNPSEKLQDNPAFFAELMAALAVLDYVNETLERGKIKFKQIADIKSNANTITVENSDHLDKNVADQIKDPLIKLSLLSKVLNKSFLDEAIDIGYAWTKNLNLSIADKNIDETLLNFFKEFEEWKKNLEITGQKFKSPDVDIEKEVHTNLDRWSNKNKDAKGIGALLIYFLGKN